jgi:hypothetical protein
MGVGMVYKNLIASLGVEWIVKDVELMVKVDRMEPNQVYHNMRDQTKIYDKYELDIVMTHVGCDFENPRWTYNGPQYGSKLSMDIHNFFSKLRDLFS